MAKSGCALGCGVGLIGLGALLWGGLGGQHHFVQPVVLCNQTLEAVHARFLTGHETGPGERVEAGGCTTVGVFLQKNESGAVRVTPTAGAVRMLPVQAGDTDQEAYVYFAAPPSQR